MDDPTPDTAETRGLLEQARAGDRRAFEQLFAQHRAYLRQSIALRLDPRVRPRVDPSDVVQETQLEAFDRLRDYLKRQPMPFRTWLGAVSALVRSAGRSGTTYLPAVASAQRRGAVCRDCPGWDQRIWPNWPQFLPGGARLGR